jgi:hypothetical protein
MGMLIATPLTAHADSTRTSPRTSPPASPPTSLPEAGAGTAVPLTVGTVATATGVALLVVRKRHPRP